MLDHAGEVGELALGAAAVDRPVAQRGNARGIVAAILQTLQAVEQQGRHRRLAENTDNATHAPGIPSRSSCDQEALCLLLLCAAAFCLPRSLRKRAADRKSTRLNSSHSCASRMPSSA